MTNHIRLTFYVGGVHYKETRRRLWPVDNFSSKSEQGFPPEWYVHARLHRRREPPFIPAKPPAFGHERAPLRRIHSTKLPTTSCNISRPRLWRHDSLVFGCRFSLKTSCEKTPRVGDKVICIQTPGEILDVFCEWVSLFFNDFHRGFQEADPTEFLKRNLRDDESVC